MEQLNAYIGKKIREKRLAFKTKSKRVLTQAQLAEKIEVSRPTVVNYENGKQTPTPLTLMQIAHALSVGIEELFPSKRSMNKFFN